MRTEILINPILQIHESLFNTHTYIIKCDVHPHHGHEKDIVHLAIYIQ